MEKKFLLKRKLLRKKPLDWGTCRHDQGWSAGRKTRGGGWRLLVTLSFICRRCAHRALGLSLRGLESHPQNQWGHSKKVPRVIPAWEGGNRQTLENLIWLIPIAFPSPPPLQKIMSTSLCCLDHPEFPSLIYVLSLLTTNLLHMYDPEQILYSFLSDRFKK